jgi:hypothetical protein
LDPFSFVSKWLWAICIVMSFVNAAIVKSRVAPHIRANPDLEEGYRAIIKGMLIWTNVPFVVLGIRCIAGKIPSFFDIWRPRDGNPYIIAFYVSVALTWILGTNWIVFRGGAEMIVKHPGVMNVNVKSPRVVILLWFLSVAGGIAGFLLLYYQVIPMPPS